MPTRIGAQFAQQDGDQQIAERTLLPRHPQPIDRLIDHADPDQRRHEDRRRQAAAERPCAARGGTRAAPSARHARWRTAPPRRCPALSAIKDSTKPQPRQHCSGPASAIGRRAARAAGESRKCRRRARHSWPRQDKGARLADTRQIEGAARPEQEVLAQPRVGAGAGLIAPGAAERAMRSRRLERLAPEIELLALAPDQAAIAAAEAEADAELRPRPGDVGQHRQAVRGPRSPAPRSSSWRPGPGRSKPAAAIAFCPTNLRYVMPCSLAISLQALADLHRHAGLARAAFLRPVAMAPVRDRDITAHFGEMLGAQVGRRFGGRRREIGRQDRAEWPRSPVPAPWPRACGRPASSRASGAKVAETMAASGAQEVLHALQRSRILQADARR